MRLLTGADNWRTQGAGDRAPADGHVGRPGRGPRLAQDERQPSSSLPCPSALGATWDTELVGELAAALGVEARSKGVDVLLGAHHQPDAHAARRPGVRVLLRGPGADRPAGRAYVRGVQSAGVAATVKHYVGNDSETERWTYDARIGEHVLRELYLAPFEACVREAGAGLVMAAYNKVNGIPMTEHARLLRDVLKDEWGFDGVVVSDWHAARSTVATALAALDLAMPGPDGPWGEQLARPSPTARSGRGARRQAGPAAAAGPPGRRGDRLGRTNAPGRPAEAPIPQRPPPAPAHGRPGRPSRHGPAATPDRIPSSRSRPALVDPGLLRRAAAASFVLLRNEGGAAHRAGRIGRVALIGPNAVHPVIQGGGSAGVMPVRVSTPAAALAEALAGPGRGHRGAGCRTWTVPEPAAGSLRDPVTGQPGLRLEFRDGRRRIARPPSTAPRRRWPGGKGPPGVGWGEPGTIVLDTRFRPDHAGRTSSARPGSGGSR